MARAKPAPTVATDDIRPPPNVAWLLLSTLYLHPLNPRQEPPEAEIEALAASILTAGLIQNLSGFADRQIRFRPGHEKANPDDTGIVAGGRRLRALQLLAARGQWQDLVPVQITTDADLARQWAGAENETQRGLPVADRIRAYDQMARAGSSHEAIASAFTTPLTDVRRLLALANLPPDAIDALRNNLISFDIAKLLTTASSPELQAAALRSALLKDKPDWQIRDMLRKGAIEGNNKLAKFVGLDAYHAAGGTSTDDLFANHAILHDAGLLDRLATQKGLEAVEEIRSAEHWAWAEFTQGHHWEITQNMTRRAAPKIELPAGDADRLEHLESLNADIITDAEAAELLALTLRSETRDYSDDYRATSGIVGNIDDKGVLKIDRGWRRKTDEARSAAESADGSIDISPVAAEASLPQNLRDDLRRIRLICIQAALVEDAALCHDLLALHLTRRVKTWDQPFALDQTHATPPEKADGLNIPARLCSPQVEGIGDDAAVALKVWLTTDAAAIDRAAVAGIARAFCRTEGAFVDLIHARRPIAPRAIWTPTAPGFLNRVSAGYLDAMWRDLVPDEGSLQAGFASLTKKQKSAELAGLFSDASVREAIGLSRDQNAIIDAWTPEELRFDRPSQPEDQE